MRLGRYWENIVLCLVSNGFKLNLLYSIDNGDC